MMRMDQFPGLTKEGYAFLTKNVKPGELCKHCGHITPSGQTEIDYFEGMFGDEFPLFRHPLKDGGHADEFLQETHWSSGAVHFLGLDVPSKNLTFAWTSEAIEAWL